MVNFCDDTYLLLTYFRKKWLVSIGIEILRTIEYQQVVSYLRMVASITES